MIRWLVHPRNRSLMLRTCIRDCRNVYGAKIVCNATTSLISPRSESIVLSILRVPTGGFPFFIRLIKAWYISGLKFNFFSNDDSCFHRLFNANFRYSNLISEYVSQASSDNSWVLPNSLLACLYGCQAFLQRIINALGGRFDHVLVSENCLSRTDLPTWSIYTSMNLV